MKYNKIISTGQHFEQSRSDTDNQPVGMRVAETALIRVCNIWDNMEWELHCATWLSLREIVPCMSLPGCLLHRNCGVTSG